MCSSDLIMVRKPKIEGKQKVNCDSNSSINMCTYRVTAKTATPAEVDSKLSEAHLESLERATKALEGT